MRTFMVILQQKSLGSDCFVFVFGYEKMSGILIRLEQAGIDRALG